jgi:hypothetical protein
VKLILTDDDGTVLDTTTVTEDEWWKAIHHPIVAMYVLAELIAGDGYVGDTDEEEQYTQGRSATPGA